MNRDRDFKIEPKNQEFLSSKNYSEEPKFYYLPLLR
jgi:hypothetical protein